MPLLALFFGLLERFFLWPVCNLSILFIGVAMIVVVVIQTNFFEIQFSKPVFKLISR
jgi:hypothetical protein